MGQSESKVEESLQAEFNRVTTIEEFIDEKSGRKINPLSQGLKTRKLLKRQYVSFSPDETPTYHVKEFLNGTVEDSDIPKNWIPWASFDQIIQINPPLNVNIDLLHIGILFCIDSNHNGIYTFEKLFQFAKYTAHIANTKDHSFGKKLGAYCTMEMLKLLETPTGISFWKNWFSNLICNANGVVKFSSYNFKFIPHETVTSIHSIFKLEKYLDLTVHDFLKLITQVAIDRNLLQPMTMRRRLSSPPHRRDSIPGNPPPFSTPGLPPLSNLSSSSTMNSPQQATLNIITSPKGHETFPSSKSLVNVEGLPSKSQVFPYKLYSKKNIYFLDIVLDFGFRYISAFSDLHLFLGTKSKNVMIQTDSLSSLNKIISPRV